MQFLVLERAAPPAMREATHVGLLQFLHGGGYGGKLLVTLPSRFCYNLAHRFNACICGASSLPSPHGEHISHFGQGLYTCLHSDIFHG